MPLTELFGPNIPCSGMFSALAPSVLNPSQWAYLANIRIGNGYMQLRDGFTQAYAGAVGNTLPSGRLYLMHAVHEPTGIIVMYITGASANHYDVWYYNPTSNHWVALRSAVASSTYNASFMPSAFITLESPAGAAWKATYPTKLVVQAEPDTAPDIYHINIAGTTVIYAGTQTLPPAPDPAFCTAEAHPSFNWAVGDASLLVSGKVHDSAGAGHAVGTLPTTINSSQNFRATFGTSTVAGDSTAFYGMAATTNASTHQQLQILYDCNDALIWDKVKIELRTTAPAFKAVHDPTASTAWDDDPQIVATGIAGVFQISWPLVNSAITSATYDGIRFTWANPASPSGSIALNIYHVGFGAGMPGGGDYAVAIHNRTTEDESPATVLRNKGGVLLKDISSTNYPGLQLVDSDVFYYNILASVPYSAGNEAAGDHAIMYYDGTGSATTVDEFHALGTDLTFAASGGSDPLQVQFTLTDATTYARTATDSFGLDIPWGSKVMTTLNGRLVCGNAFPIGSGSNLADTSRKAVQISDRYSPYRFSSVPRTMADGTFDATSPASLTLNNEVCVGLTTKAGQDIGGDILFILTQNNTYVVYNDGLLDLETPRLETSHGCLAGQTVTVMYDTVIWLDSERQVRVLGSALDTLSKRTIEDILKIAPAAYFANAKACQFGDKYFLAFTPSGQTTNTQALVFDFREMPPVITLDIPTSKTFRAFQVASIAGTPKRMFFFNSDGLMYEYEAGATTDSGSAIVPTFKTREFHAPAWDQSVMAGRLGVMMDKPASGTLTTNRTCRQTTASVSATINLTQDGSNNSVWSYDKLANGNFPGIADPGIQFTLTGSLPGGTKFVSIAADVGISGTGVKS